MPPFWPFKRSKSDEAEGPGTIDYDRDENTAETLADRSHVEDEGYQAAMNLLDNPHLGSPDQGEAVSQTIVEPGETFVEQIGSERDPSRYTESGDSYWYYQNEDGTFEPEPHVKNADGSFAPYSG